MSADRLDPASSRPAVRAGLQPVTRAFLGGLVVGLVLGGVFGWLVASRADFKPKWADAAAAFVRLPEQTALGPPPQTVTLPASTYDFGGVGAPLNQAVVDAGSLVRVEVQAQAGRVGVSLAKPNGGELVSREAVVTPQQGKTTVYFRTGPGMGPVTVLLRSADDSAAGASAVVSKVQTAREADLSQREKDAANRAGIY